MAATEEVLTLQAEVAQEGTELPKAAALVASFKRAAARAGGGTHTETTCFRCCRSPGKAFSGLRLS